MAIRKFSPVDQNANNFFKIYDTADPTKDLTPIDAYKYTLALDSGSVTAVDRIRLTLPGGSPVTYTFAASYATTTAVGRAAIIDAINLVLAGLGYDGGVAGMFDDPTFTIFTANSELVFVGVGASGNELTASEDYEVYGITSNQI